MSQDAEAKVVEIQETVTLRFIQPSESEVWQVRIGEHLAGRLGRLYDGRYEFSKPTGTNRIFDTWADFVESLKK